MNESHLNNDSSDESGHQFQKKFAILQETHDQVLSILEGNEGIERETEEIEQTYILDDPEFALSVPKEYIDDPAKIGVDEEDFFVGSGDVPYLRMGLAGSKDHHAQSAKPVKKEWHEVSLKKSTKGSVPVYSIECKSASDGGEREKLSIHVEEEYFESLKKKVAPSSKTVRKTRTTVTGQEISGEKVKIKLDSFPGPEDGKRNVALVEVEGSQRAHRILEKRVYGLPAELQWLAVASAYDVTEIHDFYMKQLARKGGEALDSIDDIRLRLVEQAQVDLRNVSMQIVEITGGMPIGSLEATQQGQASLLIQQQERLRHRVDKLTGSAEELGPLADEAINFGTDLGKPTQLRKATLKFLFSNLRNRLYRKPQMFPTSNLVRSDETSRGRHLDYVALAAEGMATELGLNTEVVRLSALMHDVGHPVGGHIGEEWLDEKAKEAGLGGFEHHIFSLYLGQAFDINPPEEVSLASYAHKSGGKALMASGNMSQESALVRIADKIAYTCDDAFSAMDRGVLCRSGQTDPEPKANAVEIDEEIFQTLGENREEWLGKLMEACVTESKAHNNVQFTEQGSGEVFGAYEKLRSLVYNEVHPKINWRVFRGNIDTVYEMLPWEDEAKKIVFTAYLTDDELIKIVDYISGRLEGEMPLSEDELRSLGIDAMELIDAMDEHDDDLPFMISHEQFLKGDLGKEAIEQGLVPEKFLGDDSGR